MPLSYTLGSIAKHMRPSIGVEIGFSKNMEMRLGGVYTRAEISKLGENAPFHVQVFSARGHVKMTKIEIKRFANLVTERDLGAAYADLYGEGRTFPVENKKRLPKWLIFEKLRKIPNIV